MSSTAHPHIADFCIDDVVDQNVCRTQSETNAWLSIQLPGESDSTDDPGTVRKEVGTLTPPGPGPLACIEAIGTPFFLLRTHFSLPCAS